MTASMLTTAPACRRVMIGGRLLLAAPILLASTGCVRVTAPDKPIEINLTINIRQEVVVRLQQDARELIEKNPGVF